MVGCLYKLLLRCGRDLFTQLFIKFGEHRLNVQGLSQMTVHPRGKAFLNIPGKDIALSNIYKIS
jgi:hypothetical protein